MPKTKKDSGIFKQIKKSISKDSEMLATWRIMLAVYYNRDYTFDNFYGHCWVITLKGLLS